MFLRLQLAGLVPRPSKLRDVQHACCCCRSRWPILRPRTTEPRTDRGDRQACRSDFISHCSGVQPGGREALQCLERNAAQLSTDCGSAVSAVCPRRRPETKPETPPPAARREPQTPRPSQPPQQDELTAVQQACTIKDFMSHCSWIAPGNPELLLCLRANAAELSPACQNVVRATPPPPRLRRGRASGDSRSAGSGSAHRRRQIAVPAACAAHRGRTAAAHSRSRPARSAPPAVRISYRTAAGVQPGGRDAFMCLERNQAEVSPSCQTALAAIGGGAANPQCVRSRPGRSGRGSARGADRPAADPAAAAARRDHDFARLRRRSSRSLRRCSAGRRPHHRRASPATRPG